MPSYEYTDPQGKSFTLEVDEELNPDQVYQKFADAGIAPRIQQPNQESPGYLSQLGGALSTGYGQMTSGVGATFNALTGDVPDVAANLAEMGRLQREQQAAQTPEDLALAQEFARTEEEYERARGPLESMSALSGYLGATMRHPGAAVKQAVQSAPNALISGATGLAGYALGGLAGGAAGIETGPGAILTGIAGATAGGAISNSLMEAGPAIYDILNEKTGGAAASMTADQIAEYLKKNPDIMSEGLKTGAVRGTVIGAIEGLGLKGAGRLATIPERAAARAAQKTLVDAGVDIASKEAVEAALKRPALRSAVEAASNAAKEKFTSAGNLARMGGAAGIEIGASGAGELGAQMAAGQEVSPTEIYQEMLGEGVLSLPVAATSKALEARKYLMPEAQAGEIPSTPEQEFTAPADTVPAPVSPEEETMRNPALEIAKEVGEASTANLAAIGSEQSTAAMAEFNATLDEIEAQAAQPTVQPSEEAEAFVAEEALGVTPEEKKSADNTEAAPIEPTIENIEVPTPYVTGNGGQRGEIVAENGDKITVEWRDGTTMTVNKNEVVPRTAIQQKIKNKTEISQTSTLGSDKFTVFYYDENGEMHRLGEFLGETEAARDRAFEKALALAEENAREHNHADVHYGEKKFPVKKSTSKVSKTTESPLVTPEEESLAAQRRADLLSAAADAAKGKTKAQVSPVVTAMVTPQQMAQGELPIERGRHRFSKASLGKLPKVVADFLSSKKTNLDKAFNFAPATSVDLAEDGYYTLINPATGESRTLSVAGEFSGLQGGANRVEPTSNVPIPPGAYVGYRTPQGAFGVLFNPQQPTPQENAPSEIPLQESLPEEPQDRVESREAEEAGVGDQLRGAAEGEEEVGLPPRVREQAKDVYNSIAPTRAGQALTQAAEGVVVGMPSPVDELYDNARLESSRWPSFVEESKKAADKLYSSYAGVRDALRKQFGPTIRLFRYQGSGEEAQTFVGSKKTLNWASTEAEARQYKGENRVLRVEEIPIEDIVAVNVGPKGDYEEFVVFNREANPDFPPSYKTSKKPTLATEGKVTPGDSGGVVALSVPSTAKVTKISKSSFPAQHGTAYQVDFVDGATGFIANKKQSVPTSDPSVFIYRPEDYIEDSLGKNDNISVIVDGTSDEGIGMEVHDLPKIILDNWDYSIPPLDNVKNSLRLLAAKHPNKTGIAQAIGTLALRVQYPEGSGRFAGKTLVLTTGDAVAVVDGKFIQTVGKMFITPDGQPAGIGLTSYLGKQLPTFTVTDATNKPVVIASDGLAKAIQSNPNGTIQEWINHPETQYKGELLDDVSVIDLRKVNQLFSPAMDVAPKSVIGETQTTQAAAETQTPESTRKDSGAAGFVQSEPVEGSIPTDEKESAKTAIESTEKSLEQPGYGAKLNAIRKSIRDLGPDSQKAQTQALNDLMAMPLADLQAAFEVVTGIPTKLANKRQLANNVLNEILAESRNEKLPEADETFRKAEIEAEEEIQRQNAQSLARIFNDKLRTNPVKGLVSSGDVERAIGQLQNSGEVPGAIFTWRGTAKELQRLAKTPAFKRAFPGAAQAAEQGNVEGIYENGMAFVITDQVVVTDLDRARAKVEGTTPEVAAVKRVISHENYHKGVALLSPKDQAQLVSLLRKLFPAAELDDLAKSYKQYADWRTNRASEYALLEEKMQKAIEEMKEVPRDGLLRELVDFLKAIWRKWTGQPKGEPKLRDLKDVVRLLRSTLKDAHKAQANRTANGGRVMMSLPAFRNFVPAVNLNGRIETGASHYEAWLKHAIRQIPSYKKDGLSDSEVKDLADKWLVDHPEAMANSMTKEGFVTDEGYLNRQDSLKKFLALGGKQRLDPGEVRDWLDSADVESARMSLGTNLIDAEYLEAVANGDMEKAQRMVDQAAKAAGYNVGPVFHRTKAEFTVFDLSKSSSGAVWGPAIYASLDDGSWNPASLKDSRVIKGYVGGKVIDLTQPSVLDLQLIGKLIGRDIDTIPLVTLERRYGSVAEGLKAAGFSAALHKGPGSTGNHIAVFEPNQIKSADPVTYDDAGNVIPLSQRFQPTSPDIRFSLSPVQYSSENDEIQSSAQQTSRSMDYTPRQLEVHFAVRKAYDAMPKDNGVAVPLYELFDKTKEFVPDLNAQEFSQIVQGLYDDNAALLNTGAVSPELSFGGPSEEDSKYLAAIKAGDIATAQKMVDEGKVRMTRRIFDALDVRPELTQRATTIHKRLTEQGIIQPDAFENGRGLVYGDGKGVASKFLGADSYEPFPPSDFQPDYVGDRSAGDGSKIGKTYETILNTFVLNVVDPQTRDFIVRDIANLLKKGGRAVIVTRGTDVLNSTPIQDFGGMSRLQKSGSGITYQKGFSQGELVEYLRNTLGEGFAVQPLKGGSAGDVRAQFVKNTEEALSNPYVSGTSQFPILNRDNEPASSVVILPGKGMASLGTALSPEEYARHAELEAKNKAGTITPEETKEAEKLVEKAAKAAGYNVGPVFHGSFNKGFTEFDMTRGEKGAHFGTLEQATTAASSMQGFGGEVRSFFLRGKVTPVVEDAGEWNIPYLIEESMNMAGIPVQGDTLEAVKKSIADLGYDVVAYNNRGGEGEGISYLVWNPNQIKLADPFTGVPLEQRFDVTSPDIRFSYGASDSSAAATYRNEVDVISKGLPVGREYQGAPMKGMTVEDHATFNQNAMGDAAERLLKSLSKDHSMEEIFELLQQPDFQRELGLFDPTMVKSDAAKLTYLKLVAQLKQRAWHASNKAKTEGQRIKANVLYRQVSQYYANLTTGGGQFLQSIQQIHEDPRSRFAFDIERAENEMAKANAEAVENQSGPEGMNSVKVNIENMVNGSGESATEDILEDVEEDQDAIDLAEGEATLEGEDKTLWEKVKDWLREIGAATKQLRAFDRGGKASLSSDQRNAIAGMSKEDLVALIADRKKKVNAALKKLLGEESEAKTPEQKAKRKKRGGMIDAAQKRVEAGKEVDPKPSSDPTMRDVLREINKARREIKGANDKPIQWVEILRQSPKSTEKAIGTEEYRKRIFDAMMAGDAFKGMSDEQKSKLADLFSEAWEKKRTAILDKMLDTYSENLDHQKEKRKLAKALKDSRNQLLELVNLGAYNNDELVRAIGERFGLKTEFTAEEKAKLNELADKLQDDTLNRAKRNKLAREYLSLLESATGIPASELMSMIWVTSVLNGGGTIFSIATSFLNGFYVIMGNHAARAWTELARGNYKEAVDIMLDTFKAMSKWLQSYAPSAERAWNYLWTGDVSLLEAAANDPFKNVKTLGDIQRHQANAERLAKDPKLVKQYIGRYLRFWGRLLTALDAFNVMTNKAAGMALAMRQSGLTSEQIKEIDAAHDMAVFKKRIIETDPFFKGQKPTDSFGRSYLTSLAEAAMYESLAKMGVQVENADFMASEAAYTMNPTGVGGIFYNFVKGVDTKATNFTKDFMKRAEAHWAKEKNWDTGWEMFLAHLAQFLSYQVVNAFGLRFARFAGNKFNQGLSFIPGVGLLRRRELSNEHLKGREQAFIDSIKRNQIAGLLMGVIGFSLLKAIVDEPDDEKRGWSINGGFNNLNPDQQAQMLAQGKAKYSITIGNMVWKYQNWPIAQPLAAIGAMADMIRFSPDKWKSKNVGDKLMTSALSGLKATLEIPALTQIGELLGTGVSSKDPTEQTQNRLVRALAGWSGGFMPRFLKDIDYMAEPTMRKYETFWQKTSSHIPVYRRYTGKDFYDILGNPVEKNAIPGSREFAKLDERPEYQILGALNSRGIWLTPANAEYRMIGKGRNRRRLTQEEADKYSLESGKEYRKMLIRYGARALRMPPEKAKNYISDLADKARDRALDRVAR